MCIDLIRSQSALPWQTAIVFFNRDHALDKLLSPSRSLLPVVHIAELSVTFCAVNDKP